MKSKMLEHKMLAIDVALIPEQSCWKKLQMLNQSLSVIPGLSFSFDRHHLPHLTLWQDFIAADRLPDLVRALAEVAWDIPDEVSFSELNTDAILGAGAWTPCLEMDMNSGELKKLRELHLQVLSVGAPWSSRGSCDQGHFFGDNARVHSRCHRYVQEYVVKKPHEHFFPHLTLGVGNSVGELRALAANMSWPWSCPIGGMVLAQLGNVCTVSSEVYWQHPVNSHGFHWL